MVKFELLEPETLDEAFQLMEEHGDNARLMAGGTALVLLMKQRLLNPDYLIHLMNIKELAEITFDPKEGLRIGSLVRHAEIEWFDGLRETYPALFHTFHDVAQPRVRNMATIGGNLCHADPTQDPGSTLIALGATVELAKPGSRRSLPVEEFFSDYYETVIEENEILTEVSVPAPKPNTGQYHIKFTPRTVQDYATVGVAVWIEIEGEGNERCKDIRIAFNSVAPTIIRATAAEDVLRGNEISDELLVEAGEAAAGQADPTDDVRGSADYKTDMVKVFTKRCTLGALAAVK